ncbi:MAG TPA: 3-methyl-2-oxobutanoate hydroxymethyltransferase, partial [bacterium]|nr:3-methyl-2-oxobutanoate hydroxymethyltransferase [bacterium]
IYHTKCVSAAVKNSFILADMPFLSYQISERDAILNAGNLLKLGGANGVKLEGGAELKDLVKKLTQYGIPVAGHIGLTPQYINSLSGYKVQGKTPEKIKQLINDALALQESGAFCIILECIPEEVSKIITEKLEIPTIGIGAGKYCDGQVLVINDLLGLTNDFRPKFVKSYINLHLQITDAVIQYKNEVLKSVFPDAQHSFNLTEDCLKDLQMEYKTK